MPELQRLQAAHASSVLAFELANRAYFADPISDRGDEFFDNFTERHRTLLTEQNAGIGTIYVLVADDGTVIGWFNVIFGTATLPNSVTRSRSSSPDAESRLQPCGTCANSPRRNTGFAPSERPPRARTQRPGRCCSRAVSSRSVRPTQQTSAVSAAPGTSATKRATLGSTHERTRCCGPAAPRDRTLPPLSRRSAPSRLITSMLFAGVTEPDDFFCAMARGAGQPVSASR